MKMSAPALVPLLSLLTGCTITLHTDGDDEVNGDGDGDGDSSTTAGTEGSTSSTDEIGTDTSTATSTATDTGGDEFCGLSEGPAEPWIVLSQLDVDLVEGGQVGLECGGQGSFMIRFNVALGGFVPTDPDVPVKVVLDVEGYNLGTDGHFAQSDYTVFVGCCSQDYNSPDYCYYDPLLVTMFPPDQIPDLEVLNGLPGSLTITLTADGVPVEQTLAVTMWAVPDDTWVFCSYGYYGTSGYGGTGYGSTGGYGTTGGLIEPHEINSLPIPLD